MLFGVYLVSLLKQDDSDVFLIYMEGEPGAMRTCISHTHGRLEVLIMRRQRKRPCQNMGFPLSLVLSTSRRQQQWVTAQYKLSIHSIKNKLFNHLVANELFCICK